MVERAPARARALALRALSQLGKELVPGSQQQALHGTSESHPGLEVANVSFEGDAASQQSMEGSGGDIGLIEHFTHCHEPAAFRPRSGSWIENHGTSSQLPVPASSLFVSRNIFSGYQAAGTRGGDEAVGRHYTELRPGRAAWSIRGEHMQLLPSVMLGEMQKSVRRNK
jgi:hypothetical protein